MKAKIKATGEIIEVMKICSTSTIWQSGLGGKAKLWNQSDLDFDIYSPVTFEGYVARNENGSICLHNSLPERIVEEDVYYGYWGKFKGKFMKIPEDLFPSVTWESQPKRVRITITPMEE